jgi:hypothetical protein
MVEKAQEKRFQKKKQDSKMDLAARARISEFLGHDDQKVVTEE